MMYKCITGNCENKTLDLHEKYGPVVRVGVNELSYISPQAWVDIYGQRPGVGQMPKVVYKPPEGFEARHMLIASTEDHTRHRRLLTHAFSDRALREQEPIVKEYVDLLMQRLGETAGEKVDMTAWFNFATFDIIGDLAFGDSFNCLRDSRYHPWVTLIFSNVKAVAWSRVAQQIPGAHSLLMKLAPKEVVAKGREHVELCKSQANKRLAEKTDRPDFMSYIIRHNDKETGMSLAEIHANTYVIIIGGSETTATLLSGAVYFLLRNPGILAALSREIRSAFAAEADITFASVSRAETLLAVLTETLRAYPPVPSKLPRTVPAGGATVDGAFVPAGTVVSVCHWAATHAARNFRDPWAFAPERWAADAAGGRFAEDRRDAFQPFGFGPRNCIGRNLAYMEMRLILARLVWNFDLELCKESVGWEKQKSYILWEKGPLWVRCKPVVR